MPTEFRLIEMSVSAAGAAGSAADNLYITRFLEPRSTIFFGQQPIDSYGIPEMARRFRRLTASGGRAKDPPCPRR